EVLVQLVIAAITTEPWRISASGDGPPTASDAVVPFALGLTSDGSAAAKPAPTWESETRSCGRFGPATDGSTAPSSRSRVSEYSASAVRSSWNSPCSLQ